MADTDKKNISDGMTTPGETATKAPGALSDTLKNAESGIDETETDTVNADDADADDADAEEYGQLSFDFCKSDDKVKTRQRVRRAAESLQTTDTKTEDASGSDEEYEQLSFDFAANTAKTESEAESESESESETKPAASESKELPADIVIAAGTDSDSDDSAKPEQQAPSSSTDSEAGQTAAGTADKPRSRKKQSRKSHTGRKLLIGAAALLAAAYCGGIYFFSRHFLPNTHVQGVDIGYLDAAAAEAKLQSDIVYDSILLKGRSGDEVLRLDGAEVVKSFSSTQEAISAQDKLLWIRALLVEGIDPGIKLSAEADEEKLNEAISALSMLNPDNITSFSNAHPKLNAETNLYEVEAETEGNDIDTDAFTEAVREAIANGCAELDLDEAGVYKEPTMRSDSSLLAGQIDWMNSINSAGASLDLGAGVVIPVNGELIGALVGADGMADEQAVRNYVTWIAVTYNTSSADKTRSFINHNNIEKIINTSYGWELNEDKTYPLLFELINKVIFDTTVADTATLNPEDYAIKAVWKKSAASHAENDLGPSYIEIDMGEQNVYVYIDGNCVLTTPCVTGRMTKGRMTPEGMYQIQYKQKNRYLTGRNPNGSISYRSYVHYWMPFNGGIGLHDATWRSKFGGNLYVGGGSHGCINLPLDMAQQLYDIVYTGMPVVCYY